MAARRLGARRYAALEALLDGGPDAASLSEVLANAPGVLAARAARAAAELGASELVDALEAAYRRLARSPLDKGADADPGCRGKLGCVESLRELSARSASVFADACGFVQPEPVWGGTEDTAGPLRVAGLAGLVEMHHADTLLVAAELLADPLATVRSGAASALAGYEHASGPAGACALLRLRARAGDAEPEVLQASLASLIALDGDAAAEYAASWLNGDSATEAEAASFALGAARTAAALRQLTDWHAREVDAPRRAMALNAIAIGRMRDGFDFLYACIESHPDSDAGAAIEALSMYAGDEAIAARALEAAEARGSDRLVRRAREMLEG